MSSEIKCSASSKVYSQRKIFLSDWHFATLKDNSNAPSLEIKNILTQKFNPLCYCLLK